MPIHDPEIESEVEAVDQNVTIDVPEANNISPNKDGKFSSCFFGFVKKSFHSLKMA